MMKYIEVKMPSSLFENVADFSKSSRHGKTAPKLKDE